MDRVDHIASLCRSQCDTLLTIADYLSYYDLENNPKLNFMLSLKEYVASVTLTSSQRPPPLESPFLESDVSLPRDSMTSSNRSLILEHLRFFKELLSRLKILIVKVLRSMDFFKKEVALMDLHVRQKTVILKSLYTLGENNKILAALLASFYTEAGQVISHHAYYPYRSSPLPYLRTFVQRLTHFLVSTMNGPKFNRNNHFVYDLLDEITELSISLDHLEEYPFDDKFSTIQKHCKSIFDLSVKSQIFDDCTFDKFISPFSTLMQQK